MYCLLSRRGFQSHPGTFRELLRKQMKLLWPPGAAASNEANLASRLIAEQRSGDEAGSKQ
jgi:hypothetical protein